MTDSISAVRILDDEGAAGLRRVVGGIVMMTDGHTVARNPPTRLLTESEPVNLSLETMLLDAKVSP